MIKLCETTEMFKLQSRESKRLIGAKAKKNHAKPREKILLTLFILFLFRLGNTIPLGGIDQMALKKSIFQLNSANPIMQIVSIYASGGTSLITPFSLGIIPFINSSIIIDLLTAVVPFLEKLQSEEGEFGRKKIALYKKILALIFSIAQSFFLIFYIKAYFYNINTFNICVTCLELVTGSMLIIWLCNILDNRGIGNGASLIILTNIVITLLGKQDSFFKESVSWKLFAELTFLLILIFFICISQTARINIDVVSARQLIFLESADKTITSNKGTSFFQSKENGLSIRLNQAGIFPIIIASNLLPVISYITEGLFGQKKYMETLLYYCLIVGFNYFYTILFWDPEKISDQLRKASVSIVNVAPGQETVLYLGHVVRASSIIGGAFLCSILLFYDFAKLFLNGDLLNKINISSLIIIVGVAYEIQKTLRSLYKNNLEKIY